MWYLMTMLWFEKNRGVYVLTQLFIAVLLTILGLSEIVDANAVESQYKTVLTVRP